MADTPPQASQFPLLFRITNRAVIFAAAWLLVMLLFFLQAQFRQFLDENLLILARLLSFVSIALLAALCCHLIQIIVYTIMLRNLKYLACLGIFVPALIIAVTALGVSLSISYMSAGF
jgi:hypothetical protein